MIDIAREIEAVHREVGDGRVPAGDGRAISLQRDYDAPIEDVWDALTNPERLSRWFLPVSGDYRLGGSFQFDGNAGGRIVACERPHRLQVTWVYGEMADEAAASVLEVTLSDAEAGATRFELRHTAVVPEEAWAMYGPGAVGVGWDRGCWASRSTSWADRSATRPRGSSRPRDGPSRRGRARRGAKRTWRPAPIRKPPPRASPTRSGSTHRTRRPPPRRSSPARAVVTGAPPCHAGSVQIRSSGAKVTHRVVPPRPRIVLLAAPETSASVLYGLYDVLLSVGAVYPDMTVGAPGEAMLDVQIVAASGQPFRCFGDVLVEPAAALADVTDIDAVVICDMYTPITTAPRGKYEAEVAWLRRVYASGALVATVCTGSVLLAETGLLDGRSCASHWAYGDLFREAYPEIDFRAGQILDLTHEDERLITGGGVTAWQDLALHLIGRYCGPEHAVRTAKVYLLGGHENGQLPFSAMTRRAPTNDAAVQRALAWIEASYGAPNPVRAMAAQAGLLPRTFARRFFASTGRRPIEYVHALRIEAARHSLEGGDAAVDDIGYAVGYEDPAFFRRLFKRATGMTPAAYRRSYAGIAADVGTR